MFTTLRCKPMYAMVLLGMLATVAVPAAPPAAVPAGDYTLDPAHASLLFRVNHLGFSHYTARFKSFTAKLHFDPQRLANSTVEVSVDTSSLETDFPAALKLDFNSQLRGPEWLDAARYPTMTYRSQRVVLSGAQSMRIEGQLTLHGVTKPLVLVARYNGGYAGHPMDPHARIGFSASGQLQRSAFGISNGIPAPGTTLGVSDEVDVIVEAEFSGPPLLAVAQVARPSR